MSMIASTGTTPTPNSIQNRQQNRHRRAKCWQQSSRFDDLFIPRILYSTRKRVFHSLVLQHLH
jgi:hypothetical protein